MAENTQTSAKLRQKMQQLFAQSWVNYSQSCSETLIAIAVLEIPLFSPQLRSWAWDLVPGANGSGSCRTTESKTKQQQSLLPLMTLKTLFINVKNRISDSYFFVFPLWWNMLHFFKPFLKLVGARVSFIALQQYYGQIIIWILRKFSYFSLPL